MSYRLQDVESACDGLVNAVGRLLDRFERCSRTGRLVPKEIRTEARRIVEHIRFCLVSLTKKRLSLTALLEWYEQTWKNELIRNNRLRLLSTEQLTATLQHMMHVLLMALDGFVLVESGECRHRGDKAAARRLNYFRSRLTTLSTRADGYTCMYRPDSTYSGFGWDEWQNEDVGLRVRLCQCLAPYHNKARNPETVWNHLLDDGSQTLELLFDQHETAVRQLRNKFNDIKDMVLDDLRAVLKPSKLSMQTQDKLERFEMHMSASADHPGGASYIIELKRRGDSFQVTNPMGVLPEGYYAPSDWMKALPGPWNEASDKPDTPLRYTKTARKRRHDVIADSDSDSNDGLAISAVHRDRGTQKAQETGCPSTASTVPARDLRTATTAASGLVVVVEQKFTPQEREESLVTIKRQMGVNVDDMEAAHDRLLCEDQRQQSSIHGQEWQRLPLSTGNAVVVNIDDVRTAQHEPIASCPQRTTDTAIENGRSDVKRAHTALRKAQSRVEVDPNEVWDARDALREANMALGNVLLWISDDDAANVDERYGEALHAFLTAEHLVLEQQKAHDTTDASLGANIIQRNLYLLLGQAQVNRGIAYTEWAIRYSRTKPAVMRRHCETALMHLNESIATAAAMLGTSQRDRASFYSQSTSSSHRDWVSIETDVVRADQLQCMAKHWKGMCLWLMSVLTPANLGGISSRGDYEHAAHAWDDAVSTFGRHKWTDRQLKDGDVSQKIAELGIECIDVGLHVVDLAWQKLQKCVSDARRSSARGSFDNGGCNMDKDWKRQGDSIMADLVRRFAGKVVKLHGMFQSVKNRSGNPSVIDLILVESNVLNVDAMKQVLREVEDWWTKARDGSMQIVTEGEATLRNAADKGAVGRNELSGSVIVPVLVGNNRMRRCHRQRRRFGSMYTEKRKERLCNDIDSNAFLQSTDGDGQDDGMWSTESDKETAAMTRYRRWGDELFVLPRDNHVISSMSHMVFPATAPPLPPAFEKDYRI